MEEQTDMALGFRAAERVFQRRDRSRVVLVGVMSRRQKYEYLDRAADP